MELRDSIERKLLTRVSKRFSKEEGTKRRKTCGYDSNTGFD